MVTPFTNSIRQEGNDWIIDTGYKDSNGNSIRLQMDERMATGQATKTDWENWIQNGIDKIRESVSSVATQMIVTDLLVSALLVYHVIHKVSSPGPNLEESAAIAFLASAMAAAVSMDRLH